MILHVKIKGPHNMSYIHLLYTVQMETIQNTFFSPTKMILVIG